MIAKAGIAAFWIITLMTFYHADVGETQRNSPKEPDVPFPPARPTAWNLVAICFYGQSRPRYPEGFFQGSGASRFRRLGRAINRLESWYAACCSGLGSQQNSQILCCANQAWKQALSLFCMEEYSIMTLPYECCADRGEERWTCFNSMLPNPNYSPTPGYTAPPVPQELGFTFNANAC